jgi:hypothetical protein
MVDFHCHITIIVYQLYESVSKKKILYKSLLNNISINEEPIRDCI